MWRLSLILAMLLLTASSPLPNMGEVGEAAAHLNDTQTAMYFMAVLLVALLVERGMTGWRSASTTNRLATSIDKLREVICNGDAQAMANMAVIQHELRMAREDRKRIASALFKKQK